MIPLTDERLKQIAYDEIVCVTDQVRAMAAELLAARADIAALEAAARMDNDVIRQANADRADRAKSIAYLARGRDKARARVAELEAQIDRVRKVHEPIEAMNYGHRRPQLTNVCSGCGTDAGNWQMYPCPTIRALEVQP